MSFEEKAKYGNMDSAFKAGKAKDAFRTLAKETHPDHGGLAERFREVIKVKTDFDALINLANKWGIKIDGIPSGSYRKALEAIVGAIIRHAFTYKKKEQSLYGVIIKIRKITKGYSRGANEFKVFDLKSGTIWTLKTFEKQPFQEVVTLADISELETGQKKLDDIKKFTKMKNQAKQSDADVHFARLGLVKSKNYRKQITEVMVEYKGGSTKWERLTRTTPKSAYIVCFGYKNDERRIPISSVMRKRIIG